MTNSSLVNSNSTTIKRIYNENTKNHSISYQNSKQFLSMLHFEPENTNKYQTSSQTYYQNPLNNSSTLGYKNTGSENSYGLKKYFSNNRNNSMMRISYNNNNTSNYVSTNNATQSDLLSESKNINEYKIKRMHM